MICQSCGTENAAGRRFCDECGAALSSPCPACGASNRPGAKFCGECATVLGSEVAPTATAAPLAVSEPATAERRLVSVLFADLVGFTPFAEERDSEDVREILTRYFDLATDVIGTYGGTVEKFIGDAVMAVWGAPTAQEDDAERSVRAALDLVDAVRQAWARTSRPAPASSRARRRSRSGRRTRAWWPATSSIPRPGSNRSLSPGRSSSTSRPCAPPARRSRSSPPANGT